MNALAGIDYLASSGGTVWHRASALTKLLLAGALVLLAVFAPSLSLLASVFGLALVLALSSRLPGRLVAIGGTYPLLIAGLFVVATWDGSWGSPLRLLLRPLSATFTALWLVSTTPYPDLFAPISRLLPRAIGDGMFLTYRALFDLFSRTDRLWRALRIRGGTTVTVRRRLTLVGESLGTLVLHGFERSQRLYETMRLRGHSGRVCGCRHYAELAREDLLVAAVGAVVLGLAGILWRAP